MPSLGSCGVAACRGGVLCPEAELPRDSDTAVGGTRVCLCDAGSLDEPFRASNELTSLTCAHPSLRTAEKKRRRSRSCRRVTDTDGRVSG